MFKKILIANRGEIACRIIRTCQRMGIQTVGVYSEADARAVHVDMADEAYLIGPAPARQSYLNSQSLINVALKSGVQAIHPGYGFLSENPEFAEAVEKAGLTFIGPQAHMIRMMGDKLQAKAVASQAGVSVLPGSDTPVASQEDVRRYASAIGYPVLLKAVAGGGGKGMRIVMSEDQIDESLQRTTNEALSSFGDGRVFVEKYISQPRHIEIQILADHHGNSVHLGERDCSLQRRHQKVIEETPSPFLSDRLRQTMTEQSIALIQHVGYTSVGTLEFMVTPEEEFYFLEMNTRLQVEHPVTEMVTGLDLVEQMIRVAAGESLSIPQDQISFSGHAIEARLYAEDAQQNFMPSSGRITRFDLPPPEEGLRVDTGIESGSEVSVYYDPMIAKMIAWAPNRIGAINLLRRGLAQLIIQGPIHNSGFLERLLSQKKVSEGNYTTHFIENEIDQDLTVHQTNLIKAVVGLIHQRNIGKNGSSEWVVMEGTEGTRVKIKNDTVVIGREKMDIDLQWKPRDRRFVVKFDNETYFGQIHFEDLFLIIRLFGVEKSFQVMSPKIWKLFSHVSHPEPEADKQTVKAPMPGILVHLPISVGDQVTIGQTLMVIEAMKMENVIKSPIQAKVTEILVHSGDSLVRDQVLVKLG